MEKNDGGIDTLNIVFMGTPDFAATILGELADWDGCRISAAYTQPDRPRGRGREPKPSPVKVLALEKGFEVRQPLNFKDKSDVEALAALKPDVLVVAAYGLILPQSVLDVPKYMPMNVHASLLPKYRGASPIQSALLDGEFVTGITIMKVEPELDSGPILLQKSLRIAENDHAGIIHDELANMGAKAIVEALDRLKKGRLVAISQDDSKATYAQKLGKKDGLLDWNRPATEIHNRIRAMFPWPGAYFFWERDGKKIRLCIVPGKVGRDLAPGEKPGQIIGKEEGQLAIAAADKVYLTPEVTPECGKAQDASSFCCGYLNKK